MQRRSHRLQQHVRGDPKGDLRTHGCTTDLCHGSAKQGGLDLSPDVAYENLFEVPSTASEFPRVNPGTRTAAICG